MLSNEKFVNVLVSLQFRTLKNKKKIVKINSKSIFHRTLVFFKNILNFSILQMYLDQNILGPSLKIG